MAAVEEAVVEVAVRPSMPRAAAAADYTLMDLETSYSFGMTAMIGECLTSD
jgi:hypothetical protein